MAIYSSSDVELEHFEEEYFTTPQLYSTGDGYFTAMVCIFKVIY
jgi:hypothetical protein